MGTGSEPGASHFANFMPALVLMSTVLGLGSAVMQALTHL